MSKGITDEMIVERVGPTDEDEPIHAAFGLSYASYLVIPRTVLQSMPVEWQREFVHLVDLTHMMFPGWEPDGYRVHTLDKRGKFVKDPLADYGRGRRRIAPSCGGGWADAVEGPGEVKP